VGKIGSSGLLGALASGPVQLKAADAVQRREHDSPDTVVTGTAVSGSEVTHPVQMTDHTSPTGTIQTIMTTAGISSFGPFVWDDSVPRFKVNPAYTGYTIADCVNRAVYQPESITVAGEKSKKNSLIAERRKAALQAVFGITKGVVEAIMAESDGLKPRKVTSMATEGGHCLERHIIGLGEMVGARQVALRAAFWKVNGKQMNLDPKGTASAFDSEATANAVIADFISKDLEPNWATHRLTLAGNTQIQVHYGVSSKVVAFTKADAPPGTPYPDAMMPKYIDNGQTGDRLLFAGDYAGAGRPTDPNAPDTAKPPLTVKGPTTMPKAYIVVDPNQRAGRIQDLDVSEI
jgi:hypothetical protein